MRTLLPILCVACSTTVPDVPMTAAAPPVVVIISMDTTRADALGCYSAENHWALSVDPSLRPAPRTPVLDGLAASGVRFSWALSHAPTTLNSHTTMFSGLDPHRHGVPRNGYSVPASVPLLSERFGAAGWDTLAVVASSALEAKMGLNRGFSTWSDPGPAPAGGMALLGADEITRRALSAVDGRADPSAPLLLFVHYYDAHMPWFTAPPAVVGQFSDPAYAGYVDGGMAAVGRLTAERKSGRLGYADARQARALYLAQVGWVDQQVGVLLDGLRARGLGEELLVVATADHGETLDDAARFPYSHGPTARLDVLHIPLILNGTGRFALPAGAVVTRTARLQDLPATLSGLAGLGAGFGDGVDLSPSWSGGALPDLPLLAEATKPMANESKTSWNNLPFERSVALDGYLLRLDPALGPRASLHKLAPGAPHAPEPERARDLVGILQQWDAAVPAFRPAEYDAETEAALRALGYLDAPLPADAPVPVVVEAGAAAPIAAP